MSLGASIFISSSSFFSSFFRSPWFCVVKRGGRVKGISQGLSHTHRKMLWTKTNKHWEKSTIGRYSRGTNVAQEPWDTRITGAEHAGTEGTVESSSSYWLWLFFFFFLHRQYNIRPSSSKNSRPTDRPTANSKTWSEQTNTLTENVHSRIQSNGVREGLPAIFQQKVERSTSSYDCSRPVLMYVRAESARHSWLILTISRCYLAFWSVATLTHI